MAVITIGPEGCLIVTPDAVEQVPAIPVNQVIDTTGAGDAFTAALTVALVSGMEPQAALEQACVVGALATTKMGAQSSPTRMEIQQLN